LHYSLLHLLKALISQCLIMPQYGPMLLTNLVMIGTIMDPEDARVLKVPWITREASTFARCNQSRSSGLRTSMQDCDHFWHGPRACMLEANGFIAFANGAEFAEVCKKWQLPSPSSPVHTTRFGSGSVRYLARRP
jgi:hypothetical protein